MNDSGFLVYSADQINEIAHKLVELSQSHTVISLSGPLGAGKTTLVKMMLRAVGVREIITSPTFSYLNIYTTPTGKKIYHFDLYRIDTREQFLELGFDEFLYDSNALVFIEWPEKIEQLLPVQRCAITIDYYGDNKRQLRYQLT